uniref:Uncharacterized protein n=1 Tax=Vombatus ursinus TaxID=29139 RepID=A0A4X2KHG4_VOMUR
MGKKIVFRWDFGGLASAGATCVTHPLDLIKVHLQTQHRANIGFAGMTVRVISVSGFMALYNGLSASLCRQLTYSVTRFAIYHSLRDHVIHGQKQHLPFYQKVGAELGDDREEPALPKSQRIVEGCCSFPLRSYSHVLNGMTRIIREERNRHKMLLWLRFEGADMVPLDFNLLLQASCYDQIKQLVLTSTSFSDSLSIHIIASFIAGLYATLLCQPLDVLKTRMMNDFFTYLNTHSCLYFIFSPLSFQGMFPAAIRLIPRTILTFVFLEQLRLNFGIPIKSDLGQD